MANRTPKPTAKEKALATVAQSTAPVVKSRRLADAGLDDGESLEYFKPGDWFSAEEDDYSQVFSIAKAYHYTKGDFGPRVIFTLTDSEGARSLCSLPENDQRLAYVNYFKDNTIPLGPCRFKRLDTGKGNPYYQICDADEAGQIEDAEIPF